MEGTEWFNGKKKSGVTEINETLTPINITLHNSDDIANHLNCHFTQIGPNPATNLLTATKNAEDCLKCEPSSFKFAQIKPSRILKLLTKLDLDKATGLDQICNKILKLAAPVFYKQLAYLFNLSLKSLQFPHDWKLAKGFPVFKAGEQIQIIIDQYIHIHTYTLLSIPKKGFSASILKLNEIN